MVSLCMRSAILQNLPSAKDLRDEVIATALNLVPTQKHCFGHVVGCCAQLLRYTDTTRNISSSLLSEVRRYIYQVPLYIVNIGHASGRHMVVLNKQ